MRIQHPVRLKRAEREHLTALLSKGAERARKLTRCRILLLSNEGKTDTAIMEALQVARNTVRQVRHRYIHSGVDVAINERPRPGARIKFTPSQKAKITALACSEPPQGRSRWSLRLLADKLVELDIVENISYKTVERTLKKTSSNRT